MAKFFRNLRDFSQLGLVGFLTLFIQYQIIHFFSGASLIVALITAALSILLSLAIHGLFLFASKSYSLDQTILVILTMIGVALNTFSLFSLILMRFGLAKYSNVTCKEFLPIDIWDCDSQFFGYYLWQLFNLIPIVDVKSILPNQSKVEAEDFFAALPVMTFKLYVVFVLFVTIRRWWMSRQMSGVGSN